MFTDELPKFTAYQQREAARAACYRLETLTGEWAGDWLRASLLSGKATVDRIAHEDAQERETRNRGPAAWIAAAESNVLRAADYYSQEWWSGAMTACAYAQRDYARARADSMTAGDDAYDAERAQQLADLAAAPPVFEPLPASDNPEW